MLKIREEQMDILAGYSLRQFVQQAVAHLEDTFADEVAALNRIPLEDFVSEMIDKAETFGIDTEEDVLAYIEFAVQLGPNFDTRYAWAKVLSDPDLDGDEKVDLIRANMPGGIHAV